MNHSLPNRSPLLQIPELVRAALLSTALLGSGGCVAQRALVDDKLISENRPLHREAGITEQYRIGCPDVLEVSVRGRPEFDGHYTVEPDGRINLGRFGRLRIQGQTLAETARLLSAEIGLASEDVRVRVVEFRSQPILLFGAVIGWQRTVPYQGQETVHDLLQRVGGIAAGASPDHVYVVRAHVGEGRQPEVFRVDLDAIVLDNDQRTNIRLLPYDQVYVGEKRRGRVERCVPPWLRPAYQKFWRILPIDRGPREHEHTRSNWIDGKPDFPAR